MFLLMFTLTILMALSLIILFLNFLISKKSFYSREKASPFECGFDPNCITHLPFSIHFFMISLIFLIFDIEITLLIPLIYMSTFLNFFCMFTTKFFLMILILGLYLEYLEQSIDWKI